MLLIKFQDNKTISDIESEDGEAGVWCSRIDQQIL